MESSKKAVLAGGAAVVAIALLWYGTRKVQCMFCDRQNAERMGETVAGAQAKSLSEGESELKARMSALIGRPRCCSCSVVGQARQEASERGEVFQQGATSIVWPDTSWQEVAKEKLIEILNDMTKSQARVKDLDIPS